MVMMIGSFYMWLAHISALGWFSNNLSSLSWRKIRSKEENYLKLAKSNNIFIMPVFKTKPTNRRLVARNF